MGGLLGSCGRCAPLRALRFDLRFMISRRSQFVVWVVTLLLCVFLLAAKTMVNLAADVTGVLPAANGGSVMQILAADTAGSASNTLVTTGMTFPIAASAKYTLDCDLLFTVSTTSGVGLTLGVNGPGSPTEVSLMRQINTTATAFRVDSSQGTAWAAKVGATATTVTALSLAQFYGSIENGTTAGTLDVQYANIATTGTTVIKRGSWCKLQ